MVLWEITVATAYFPGLKRTYRLALKLQRRGVSPRHPKLCQFLHRWTCAAFDIALSVHREIQERDIEVGWNLRNWILCWLDRMKPSAEIRAPPERLPADSLPRNITGYGQAPKSHGPTVRFMDDNSSSHFFVKPWNLRPKSFPTISMMMQPRRPTGISSEYRHLCDCPPCRFECVFRKDIAQWMCSY